MPAAVAPFAPPLHATARIRGGVLLGQTNCSVICRMRNETTRCGKQRQKCKPCVGARKWKILFKERRGLL